MQIVLKNLRCWDPGSGYSVFLPETTPIDLTSLMSGSSDPKYVQVGPFRLKIEVETASASSTAGKNPSPVSTSAKPMMKVAGQVVPFGWENSSGSVFYDTDAVERVSTDGTMRIMGSARGCFDVSW